MKSSGSVYRRSRSARRQGVDLSHIASVGELFVSRIVSSWIPKLDELEKTASGAKKGLLESVRGKIAIATPRSPIGKYEELFGGPRWKALAGKGAQTPALAVGQYEHEDPKYRRRNLRGRTHRGGYRGHHSTGYLRRLPRHGKLRKSLTEDVTGAAKNHGQPGQGRHFHEESYGKAARRRCKAFRGCVQAIAGRHGKECRVRA